jgi:hypothetical protein
MSIRQNDTPKTIKSPPSETSIFGQMSFSWPSEMSKVNSYFNIFGYFLCTFVFCQKDLMIFMYNFVFTIKTMKKHVFFVWKCLFVQFMRFLWPQGNSTQQTCVFTCFYCFFTKNHCFFTKNHCPGMPENLHFGYLAMKKTSKTHQKHIKNT